MLMILDSEPFEVCISDEKIRVSCRSNNHINAFHINSNHNARPERKQWGFPTLGKLKANEFNANMLKLGGGDGTIKSLFLLDELTLMLLYQQISPYLIWFGIGSLTIFNILFICIIFVMYLSSIIFWYQWKCVRSIVLKLPSTESCHEMHVETHTLMYLFFVQFLI